MDLFEIYRTNLLIERNGLLQALFDVFGIFARILMSEFTALLAFGMINVP